MLGKAQEPFCQPIATSRSQRRHNQSQPHNEAMLAELRCFFLAPYSVARRNWVIVVVVGQIASHVCCRLSPGNAINVAADVFVLP